MTPPKKNHIEERGKKGDYSDLVLPLDHLILDQLTPEGTTMSGLYPIGATANAVLKALNIKYKGALSGSQITTRIRVMHMLGLTVKVKTLGQGNSKAAWQRSAKAEELLKKWKEGTNGS